MELAGEGRVAGVREDQDALFQRRMIGDIKTTALLDEFLKRPPEMVPGYVESEACEAARLAHQPHDPAALTIGINGCVIQSAERVVVVNTGSHAGLALHTMPWKALLAHVTGFYNADYKLRAFLAR